MAVDAMACTIKFPDAIMESVYERLEDKNPAIRSETTLFLLRASQKKSIKYSKPICKELLPKLLKNLEHSDKTVRESTYKFLALLSTKIDKKIFAAMTSDLKEDRKKLLAEATEALKGDGAKKPAEAPKPAEKPKEAPKKAEAAKKPAGKKVKKKPAEKSAPVDPARTGPPAEAEMTEDVALDKCIEVFGEEDVKNVQDSGWKVRLEGRVAQNLNLIIFPM